MADNPQFVSGADVQRLLDARRSERIASDTRMQCKVCWYVYDPAQGCPESQTPAGTPFKELPRWWTCPECGSDKDAFLPMDDPS